MKAVALALAASLLAGAARAEPEPNVLVQTVDAKSGSVPDVIEAYGSAAPALDGGLTLSLQQEGRVTAIAVTPGEAVRAGQRLLDFGASASASSAWQQAVSALALAKGERAHTALLLGRQLATRDQLAQADKAAGDAQASLDALRRDGAGQAARTLAAPFDGIVAAVSVAQGDRLQPGAPLMTLTRLDGLVVTVGIEPKDRARVRPGAPVALTPLDGGPALDGRVLRVDATLNPRTRLIDADVSVPGGAVISGEAFRVDVTVGELHGWLLPHEAVLTGGKGAYVFQVDGGKARQVDVSLVGAAGDVDVVDGPVDPKLKVAVAGGYQLEDGAAVREGPVERAAQ